MEVNFCFLTTFLKEELKWGIGETRPSLEVVGWIRSKQQGTQSCSINIQYYTTSTYDMVVRHFFSLFLQKWNMRAAAGWLELRGKIIGLCITIWYYMLRYTVKEFRLLKCKLCCVSFFACKKITFWFSFSRKKKLHTLYLLVTNPITPMRNEDIIKV